MDANAFRGLVISDNYRNAYVYEERIDCSIEDLPNIPDAPNTPTLHDSLGSVNPRSSWDFRPTLRKGSAGAATSSSHTTYTYTEAEEIAAMYRSRILEIQIPQRPGSAATLEGRESVKDDMSVGPNSTVVDLNQSPMTPRPTYRMSRAIALQECEIEADSIMKSEGLSPQNPIRCTRPGCNNYVRNLTALQLHLHIHNIADEIESQAPRQNENHDDEVWWTPRGLARLAVSRGTDLRNLISSSFSLGCASFHNPAAQN